LTEKKLSEQIDDYEFLGQENQKIKLSELFEKKKDLILIHNMGNSCPYCTMWADGFNGLLQHLQDRAAFVVSSPDNPKVQKDFAISRGWKFQMVSTKNTSFAKDMGFEKNGMPMPGVSIFYKEGKKITRVALDDFGPGDNYCPTWHFFDLLKDGRANWQAQFKY
jgi:predicted dithiol-disulfide oxidoreductase (DUF899 family)